MKKYILFILVLFPWFGARAQDIFQVSLNYGCVDTVVLTNLSPGYDFYVWDYGDGVVDTVYDTTVIRHVYETYGSYIISLSLGKDSEIDTIASDTVESINGIYFDIFEDSVYCTEPFTAPSGRVYTRGGVYVDTTYLGLCQVYYKLILHQKTKYYRFSRLFCQGDSVVIGDTIIRSPGNYHIEVFSPDGCDSIVDLHLYYPSSASQTIYMDFCEGESYTYRDSVLTASASFSDTLKNRCGGDSIVRYVINFYPKYETFLGTVTLCEGEPYVFFGDTIITDGYYSKKFQSVHGCDSIFTMTLNHRKNDTFLTDTIVQDSVFTWNGNVYRKSGSYSKIIRDDLGCEHLHKLRLILDHPYYIHFYDSVCGNERYLFEGQVFQNLKFDTTVVVRYKTVTGNFDSVIYLHLNVFPAYNLPTDTVFVCGNSYTRPSDKKVFTKPGTYIDTMTTVHGCDSIHSMFLILHTPFHDVVKDGVDCWESSYYWQERNKYVPAVVGTYYDTYVDMYGCDSIYELILTGSGSTQMVNLCDGDSFVLNNQVITQTGIYTHTVLNCCGTDSVITYYVNFFQRYNFFDTVHICDGSFYNFRGRMISAAGDHQDSLFTVNGCDSIYHLHLIVHQHFHSIDTLFGCSVRPYQWRNKYIRATGVYYDSIATPWGCDSIYELRAFFNPPEWSTVNASICEGDVYHFRDSDLTETGIYFDTLLSSNGCDSIVKLVLNVNPPIMRTVTKSVCDGHPYHFGNRLLTHSGTYYDTARSQAGCDSIIKLELTVYPEFIHREYDTVCTNGVYHWRNRYLTRSGVYYDTLTNIYGCDSIYELKLVIHNIPFTQLRETICQGSSYMFAGQPRTNTGRYRQVLKSVYGCDSIVELILNVQYPVAKTVSKTICNGDYYPFGGKSLTQAGIYYDTLTTIYGCDSIIRLVLQVIPLNQVTDRDVSLCEGQSFRIGQKSYNTSGVYYDTVLSSHGCDSIIKYVVTVHPTEYYFDTAYICQGDYNMFHGRRLTSPGIYYDTVQSVHGCNRIYQILLTIRPTYHFIESDTLCSDSAYHWRGRELTESGVYYDTLPTIYGCDSVYELRLGLYRKYNVVRNIPLCPGQSYHYRDIVFTEPCVYVDSLTSKHGCDSIVTLIVTRDYQHDFYDTAHICRGDYYDFFGRHLTSTGDYTEVYKTSVNGCDSIYHLHLTVNPVYIATEYDTVCGSDRYHWHGNYYSESGLYYDTVPSSLGCDSIFELNLTVHPVFFTELYKQICHGTSFQLNNKDYSRQGTYYDTLQTVHGCDSILKLVISVLPTYLTSDTVQICNGSSYTFRSHVCTNAGVYRDTVKTAGCGCDSILEVVIRVVDTFHFIESDTVCTNGAYMWREKYFTKSGTYFDSLHSMNGCDSVYELRLVINPVPVVERYHEICPGQSYFYRGRNISAQGIYFDTIRTIHGCDSIFKLTLTVAPNYFVSDTVQICIGGSYDFRGRTLTAAGIYRDTLHTAGCGCDSIFEVVIKTTRSFHFIEYDTICTNDMYLWRGQYLSEAGTYYDSLRNSDGCDSIYELRLYLHHINVDTRYVELCDGESYYYRGKNYSAQGVYYDTIKSPYGCDSIIRLVISVTPKYLISDTVRICSGNTYNFRGKILSTPGIYHDSLKTAGSGCDSIYELVLITLPKFHDIQYHSLCTNNTYLWRGRYLAESGIYFDSLRNQYGCDSVYELRLSIYHDTLVERYVKICHGQHYTFNNKDYSAQGVYYDTLQTIHGCDSILKLVLNVMPTYFVSDTVTICSGDTYTFCGKKRSQPGIYRDTIPTAGSGCDSVCELVLNTVSRYHMIEHDTVCTNGSIFWRGKSLSASGVYFDSLRSSYGCDSVYELRLVIRPVPTVERYVEICNGTSFHFRGKDYSSTGVFFDTIHTTLGCDSVFKLTVSVTPDYLFSDTAHICDGGTYLFRGRPLTRPGVYYDSLTTGSGCDSIYRLVLFSSPTYHFIEYDTLCSDVPYLWHGKHFTRSGIYFDTLQTVNGCDSVYELRLELHQPYLIVNNVALCHGSTFSIRNRVISAQGIYYDSLLSKQGCDSVIKYVVTVNPVHYFRDTAHICNGESYQFRGRTLTYPGVYRDSLLTAGGCDSIYELLLITSPSYHFIEYDTLCSNVPYPWHGMSFTEAGIYFDSLQTSNGCDSVYELRLQLNRSYLIERHIQLCHGDSFLIGKRNISRQGIYYDSLITAHGCDSIFKYVVTVSNHFITTETAVICAGEVYNFRGRPLTYAGVYRDTVPTFNSGCDSIFILTLTVNPSYHFIETDTVCSNGTYLWRGRYLTQSGTYYDSLQTVDLCDSVFELRLAVNPEYLVDYPVNICQGQSYQLRNRTISEQGIYYDTLQSIHGCDSIVRVILTVRPTYMHFDTVSICLGDVYDFHGRYVNKDGIYYDTLRTVDGCDSVCQLRLNVLPVYHFIETDTLCTNGTRRWRNRDLSVTGVYFDSLLTANGCDSVYEMRLTVFNHKVTILHEEICHGTTFYFRGQQLSQPGTYRDTLTRSSDGCDSIVELVLSVAANYFFESNATICQGDSFNFQGRYVRFQGVYYDTLHTVRSGCDSIYKLNLTVRKTIHIISNVTACANEIYDFNGTPIQQPGTYIDTFRTVDGCDSILELHISFVDPSYKIINATICPYQHYTTPTGKILNQTGTYYDTLINQTGCDSIFEIRINVIQNIWVFDTATVVKGQTYYYRNKPYTGAGIYYDTARSVHGCDTFFRLVLTYAPYMVAYLDTVFCDNYPFRFRGRVYTTTTTDTLLLPAHNNLVTDTLLIIRTTVIPHSEVYVSDTTCDGTPYFFGGVWRTKSGVYVDSLLKTNGCDSIVFLNLIVYDRMDSVGHVTICETDSYSWHGRTLTQQGVYYDTLVHPRNHCNIYYELHLDLVQETKLVIANLDNKTSVCQDEPGYFITPIYTGTTPDKYSIIYDGVIISHDNDIIDEPYVTNTIEVPIPLDNTGRKMRPDRYNVTLSLGNNYCDGSPYNVPFELLIEYPASVLDQHFNDVVSVFNATKNGGYDFTAFNWYVNGILVQGYTESNLYMTTLAPGDMVHAELRRNNENYFIPTCPLEIRDLGAEPQTTPVTLSAYFFIRGTSNAVLTSSEAGNYWLYDLKGALIHTGEVHSEINTEVSLPQISGCYLLSVRTKTSYQTFKIIVQ